MNVRERVINSLNHKESDIIPYHADFTMQEFNRIILSEGNKDFFDNTGVHLSYTQYWGWPTELPNRKEHFIDEFGVVWNRSGADKDIGVVENPIIYKPNISLWHEPKLDERRLRNEYDLLIKTKENKFVFAGVGFSMFERAWSMCGI
jgi:uroporphyrinogen decarboxylase